MMSVAHQSHKKEGAGKRGFDVTCAIFRVTLAKCSGTSAATKTTRFIKYLCTSEDLM